MSEQEKMSISFQPPRTALDLSFSIITMGLKRSIKFENTLEKTHGHEM